MNNIGKVYFKSKAIGKLSSQSLNELKQTLSDIEVAKKKLKSEIGSETHALNRMKSGLSWINWFPLKLFLKDQIEVKKSAINDIIKAIGQLEEEYDRHKLGLEISLPDHLDAAFGTLDDRFSEALTSEKIWDVTTSQMIDNVAERTTANSVIERKTVSLKRSYNPKIQCDYKALHFENANGGDLHLFPQFLLVEKDDDFALIDLLEVDVNFMFSNFIESEDVPNDAEIIDYTWAKSNKDGSRDKRFADNYQLPVVQYGELHLSSGSGLNEVYMLSNPESAFGFKDMFDEYKEALAST